MMDPVEAAKWQQTQHASDLMQGAVWVYLIGRWLLQRITRLFRNGKPITPNDTAAAIYGRDPDGPRRLRGARRT
jgi:hypothetical protein